MTEQIIISAEKYSCDKINRHDYTSVSPAPPFEEDIKIELMVWPPMRMSAHKVSHHVISFNIGAPVNVMWPSSNNHRVFCNTGNVIELLSNTWRQEMQWDGEFQILQLIFNPSLVDRLVGIENFNFISQHNIDDPFLKELVLKIHGQVCAGVVNEKIYVNSLCIACLIHLVSQYAGKKMFAPKGRLSASQLLTVIEYVRTGIQTNINLESLASAVHLSMFHFSRLFKHTMGISPYHFVLQMKIEHAKKLIRQQELGISEVAYTLNFTDQAHFSNAFKKITGLSPRQFWIGERSLSVL